MTVFDDCVQLTFTIDGEETVKNFGYDIHLINAGTVVYLGGSDNVTTQFRGIVQRVGILSKPYSAPATSFCIKTGASTWRVKLT